MLLMLSGVLTFLFHVNLAWLCDMTSTVTVGLMQEVKVLPQFAFNALFVALGVKGLDVSLKGTQLAGALLGLLGLLLYVYASYLSHTRGKLVFGRRGFRWQAESIVTESDSQRSLKLSTSV